MKLPRTDGMVFECLMNGTVRDTSGNGYHGTPADVVYEKTEREYQSYCAIFNGSTSSVSAGNVLDEDGSNAFSLSVLIKFNSVSVNQMIVGKQMGSGSFGGYMLWGQFLTGPNRFRLNMSLVSNDGTFGMIEVITPDNELVTGKWYKVDVTYDGTKSASGTKIYVNQVLKSSVSVDTLGTKSISTSAVFNVGSRNGSLPVNGNIQSVRKFNLVLSVDEIRDWYEESLRKLGGASLSGLLDGCVAKIDTLDGSELSDVVGGVAVTKVSGTAATDNLGGTRAVTNPNYTWPSIAYTTGYAFENLGSGWVLTQSPSGLSATGINRSTTLREIFLFNRTLSTDEKNALETLCNATYVLPFGENGIGERGSLPEELREGCVLFIPGAVSGSTIYDASGNGNHGTLVNSPTVTRGGLFGYSGLKFNGSTQNASFATSSTLKPTGPFSFSAVVKTTQASTTVAPVVFQSYSQVSTVAGFQVMQTISTHGTAPNRIRFVVGNNTGFAQNSQWVEAFGPTVVNDGIPHTITCQYDGSFITVYQDGEAGTPVAWTGGLAYTATSYQRLGCANRTGSDDERWTDQIRHTLITGTLSEAKRRLFRYSTFAP